MKQTYRVTQVQDPIQDGVDNSFKLCICTMLLVISLFCIILIFILLINSTKDSHGYMSDSSDYGGSGSKEALSKFPDKISKEKSSVDNIYDAEKITTKIRTKNTSTMLKADKNDVKQNAKTTAHTEEHSTGPTKFYKITSMPKSEDASESDTEKEFSNTLLFTQSSLVKEVNSSLPIDRENNITFTNLMQNMSKSANTDSTLEIDFTTEKYNYTTFIALLATETTTTEPLLTNPTEEVTGATELAENATALPITKEVTITTGNSSTLLSEGQTSIDVDYYSLSSTGFSENIGFTTSSESVKNDNYSKEKSSTVSSDDEYPKTSNAVEENKTSLLSEGRTSMDLNDFSLSSTEFIENEGSTTTSSERFKNVNYSEEKSSTLNSVEEYSKATIAVEENISTPSSVDLNDFSLSSTAFSKNIGFTTTSSESSIKNVNYSEEKSSTINFVEEYPKTSIAVEENKTSLPDIIFLPEKYSVAMSQSDTVLNDILPRKTTPVPEESTAVTFDDKSDASDEEIYTLNAGINANLSSKQSESLILSCPVCPKTSCPTCVQSCPTTPHTEIAKTKPVENECRTNQCFTMASRILSLVNATADPCEDFYTFACGGLLNNPLLLEEDLSVDVVARMKVAVENIPSSSSTPYKKFKNFYEGCVDYDKLVPIEKRRIQGREVLQSIGTFGLSSPDTNDVTSLINILFHHGSAPLFDVQFDVHSSDSSIFQMVLTPPDLTKFSFSSHFVSPEERNKHCLPKRDEAKKDDLGSAFGTYQNCMANFSNFIQQSIEALQFFKMFENLTEQDSLTLISDTRTSVKVILGTLKEYLQPQNTQQDVQNKNFKSVSVIQLQDSIPMIDWTTLFHGAMGADEDISSLFVQVYSEDQITAVFDKITLEVSPRNIINALLAIFAHDLFNDIVTTRHEMGREHYCLKVASSLMPLVASNLYLGTFSADIYLNLHSQAYAVFEQLRAKMEGQLLTAEWLDKKTLETVNEKLRNMTIELPMTVDEVLLNSSLEECPLVSKQYIQDSICLVRQFQTQVYQRFSLNPQSQEAMWPHFLTAMSTETAFIYNLNIFMVPLAVLAPLFDELIPKTVVMATLGNLLARGIGHNFDLTGMKFSSNGRMGMILSEAAHPIYVSMVEDSNMRYAYPKYHPEDGINYMYTLSDFTMLTLDERIADLTAANLALSIVPNQDSILPWVPYAPSQVYFLALAQTFCTKKKVPETFTSLYEGTSLPPFERVNTLVSNMDPFSEAFNCKIGSSMANLVKPSPFPLFKKEEYEI